MTAPLFPADQGWVWVRCFCCPFHAFPRCDSLRGVCKDHAPILASFSFSICSSRRVEVLLLYLGKGVWAFSDLRVSWGHCSCLVSCSNSLNRRWLVRQSASISSLLACIASGVSTGGRLSTSPCWSCILGGLTWLLLMFLVDTISH